MNYYLTGGSGHRLVLSNQSKKWISADGVEKIQTVSEVIAKIKSLKNKEKVKKNEEKGHKKRS